MIGQDVITIILWWFMLLILGVSILPLSVKLFRPFFDKGYVLAKVLSIATLSYLCFFFGIIHLIPFTQISLLFYLFTMTILSYGFFFSDLKRILSKRFILLAALEEVLFFMVMTTWALIRGFNPEVHGLEKYMDFGFMNSILRADFFPPKDMWMTPFTINYYYFGHLYSAVLTKLSGMPSHLTYNLILGMVAGLCFITAFSLTSSLLAPLLTRSGAIKTVLGGILTGLLTTFAGNLHTIYTLFKPYANEHPVPPWQLAFSPATFPNSYWYPNATRFIYNTIHEFPIYSWVVSDLHGHVLDIPFVLLTLSLLYSLLVTSLQSTDTQKLKIKKDGLQFKNRYISAASCYFLFVVIGFMLSVMYMTNAWDGLIYLLLAIFVILYLALRQLVHSSKGSVTYYISRMLENDILIPLVSKIGVVFTSFILFSLPFSIFFKPFVSGIGILCAPKFLTKIGHLGPFLFEADHCQHSPWWQLLILYGFFYFFVISLFIFLRRRAKTTSDVFALLLILLASILIIVPEFIYAKDIYPAHYRANTMFKLVFQSFIMLSLVSGYTIIRLLTSITFRSPNLKSLFSPVWILATLILLTGVFIYPYFSVMSYYNNLSTYQGIDGTAYLKNLYPSDFAAITWLNIHIKGQPVILEAQSDSYTDFARVSSNTGLPTVLGWTVHEWLWRGEYDYPENDKRKLTDKTPYYPAPRIGDVQTLYESSDINQTKNLIKKYAVSYVFLGDLERQKYSNLNTEKWNQLGKVIYQKGQTKIYKLSSL